MSVLRRGLSACAAAAILFSFMAAAQPSLTTIRDVLYKADGNKFNGYAVINWNSFEAGDTSNIATQFRSVRIVEGTLEVKLVPTTNADPPATYTVKYYSDGKAQFQENWAVPPSSTPLRVRDVRISAPAPLETFGLPIQESDVVGLVSDLAARPAQGPGYGTGRVIYANANGDLEAVSGDLSECVRVDGSAGPCGSASLPGFVDGETPTGPVDGANSSFALAATPNPSSSAAVYRNGVLQKESQDFTISGSSVTFLPVSVPQPGDTLLVSYRVAGGGGSFAAASYGPVMAVPGIASPAMASPAIASPATALPGILCGATGGRTESAVATSLGACTIPGGTLQPGDRVEIRFDLAKSGTMAGFHLAVQWAGSPMVERTAGAADRLVSGRAEAAIGTDSAQWSAQTWGTSLPFLATLADGGGALKGPISIEVLGNLTEAAGDALTLRNFTVLRYSR